MKKCPFCAEEIQSEAIFCRYCRLWIGVKPFAMVPERVGPESSEPWSDKPVSPVLSAPAGKGRTYDFPPLTLLDPGKRAEKATEADLRASGRRIEAALRSFGIPGDVREYHPGPVFTTYEFFPAPGVKPAKAFGDDLGDLLSAALKDSIRAQRIPGKSSLGIEVPNKKRELIMLREVMGSEQFKNSASKLTFALGKTILGDVCVTDLAVMPHLLIAGSTGTGKSVALHALIASLIYKATPDEVKLVLIDPKRLEFAMYQDLPHLLCPIVNDSLRARAVLMHAVRIMEERYGLLRNAEARNIEDYNRRAKERDDENKALMPYIVIIIDELAELMMAGTREVEFFVARLSQLGRAVGIHMVAATHMSSIDVITGTIKNCFSCRIAFRVPAKIDSKIILDSAGAEKLLGMGDMLFFPPNHPRLIRLHGAFISIADSRRLAWHLKGRRAPVHDEQLRSIVRGEMDIGVEAELDKDELYDKAVELILKSGQASASFLQRRLKMGYARAARIIDTMEAEKIIGPSEGPMPREILIDLKSYLKKLSKKRSRKNVKIKASF